MPKHLERLNHFFNHNANKKMIDVIHHLNYVALDTNADMTKMVCKFANDESLKINRTLENCLYNIYIKLYMCLCSQLLIIKSYI